MGNASLGRNIYGKFERKFKDIRFLMNFLLYNAIKGHIEKSAISKILYIVDTVLETREMHLQEIINTENWKENSNVHDL